MAEESMMERSLESNKWYNRRNCVALLAFLGFTNVYVMRVNLSVAIVAMTTNQTFTVGNVSTEIPAEFDWDSKTQGIILSAFFYGYIATQLVGGMLATRMGGKNIFGIGVLVTAIFTIFTPFLARTHVYLLILARFIEGFFEGVTYPAMHAVWSHWAPPLERTRLATFAISGGSFGTLIGFPLSGIMAKNLGWPSIFYAYGILGVAWTVLWMNFVGNSPTDDRFISESEKCYICTSIGPREEENSAIPWKDILTSVPVCGIIISHFADNWGLYTLLTGLPTYLNDVFNYDVQNSGVISALPYLLMSLITPISGALADYFRQKSIMSTTQVRKIFNCSAFLFQIFFLLIVAHSTSPAIAITALTLAVGLGGMSLVGFAVNHLDIAYQYAGVLSGISNTIGTSPGIISPTLTGFFVVNKTAAEWKIVFYVAIVIYLIGTVAYWFMASGETQPWAVKKSESHPLRVKIVDDKIQ